jgi:hypothetical protein
MIAPLPTRSTLLPPDIFSAWLGRLPADKRQALARRIMERARALGLVVVRSTGDVDIPVTLTPEVVEASAIEQRAADAADIVLGVIRTVRAVLSQGFDTPRAKMLFGHFSPFELRCLSDWRQSEDVTIARVDWFIEASGAHRALELNATIPAMEAYSDAAARAWIETVGAEAGLSKAAIEALIQLNGSNAEELRRSIVAHGKFDSDARPSIAILHRDNDPQLRELEALTRHFRSAGHVVALATPAQVSLDAEGRALVEGIPGGTPDILYRHIFARRIPEGSALERIALGQSRARLQNPVNGQHEVKGVLAELSRIISEEDGAGLDLTATQRERLSRVIPWTRLFARGACVGPDGHAADDLVQLVADQPARFVLKRSWDYGGKSVLLGPDIVAAEGHEGWRQRVDAALAEGPGAYVVQTLIASPRKRHLVVGPEGSTQWEDVFVDASTYSATGSRDVPGGGVARFARTGIVNIVGGGGVAPLIRMDVAEQVASQLHTAVAAR